MNMNLFELLLSKTLNPGHSQCFVINVWVDARKCSAGSSLHDNQFHQLKNVCVYGWMNIESATNFQNG